MKFVSWNVNGFRAVLNKGFADIFAGLMRIFSACRKLKCNRDRRIFLPKGIILIGSALRKRVTPVLLFLHGVSHFP